MWCRVIGRGREEGRARGRERDPALGEAEEAAQSCGCRWPAGRSTREFGEKDPVPRCPRPLEKPRGRHAA